MRLTLIYIILTLISFNIKAQNNIQSGILPSVSINKKLTKDWKLNFKIESREQLFLEDFKSDINLNYDYILTDFSLIAAKKVGLNSSLAAGYLMRFRNNQIHHRFIQQYVFVKNHTGFRLAHRICFDETIIPTTFIARARYRLTAEIALSGYTVDEKEFYLKLNNEYLNEIKNNSYDLEIRLVPMLGYKISDKNKIEGGFDYRINNFLDASPYHKFWLTLGWHISL